MPEINGIAHVQLTVTDMDRSVPFYRALLQSLGMTIVKDDAAIFYCVGGRTGVAIGPIDAAHAGERFAQGRPGLHHVCFRARSAADVDAIHRIAVDLGAKIIRAPREDAWAPGYYSTLFEDPDGIRIEASFVPGTGLLRTPAR